MPRCRRKPCFNRKHYESEDEYRHMLKQHLPWLNVYNCNDVHSLASPDKKDEEQARRYGLDTFDMNLLRLAEAAQKNGNTMLKVNISNRLKTADGVQTEKNETTSVTAKEQPPSQSVAAKKIAQCDLQQNEDGNDCLLSPIPPLQQRHQPPMDMSKVATSVMISKLTLLKQKIGPLLHRATFRNQHTDRRALNRSPSMNRGHSCDTLKYPPIDTSQKFAEGKYNAAAAVYDFLSDDTGGSIDWLHEAADLHPVTNYKRLPSNMRATPEKNERQALLGLNSLSEKTKRKSIADWISRHSERCKQDNETELQADRTILADAMDAHLPPAEQISVMQADLEEQLPVCRGSIKAQPMLVQNKEYSNNHPRMAASSSDTRSSHDEISLSKHHRRRRKNLQKRVLSDLSEDDSGYDGPMPGEAARSRCGQQFYHGQRRQATYRIVFRHCRSSHQKKMWTSDEERKLHKAVKHLGAGHWAEIKDAYWFPGRTNVNLKDKWRTMIKQGVVARLDEDWIRSRKHRAKLQSQRLEIIRDAHKIA